MDIVNKSKALNLLIPRLIDKSNNLAKEIESRIKLNKIFSEFENKASNNFNYFISASNNRYNSSKLGNDLDSIIYNTRSKNINEAKKIINDKFYSDAILEKEKQKMKYKSTSKINKDIRDTFNMMKLPLETKFSKNTNKEIQLILKGIDNKSQTENKNNNIEDQNEKSKHLTIEDNVKIGKRAINFELEREKNSIDNIINRYLDNINNASSTNYGKISEVKSPIPQKKYNFSLPKIKLMYYKKFKTPNRSITNEEDKKPDIRKLLPYSKLGKNIKTNKKTDENSSMNESSTKNFPFITEANINIYRNHDYNNTLNVVLNSANNEFQLQNNFDSKRRKLDHILGINDIPQLEEYDGIASKKTERIKEERHLKSKILSDSQRFEALSRKEQFNMVIDNNMELLNKLEDRIYNNLLLKKSKDKEKDYDLEK
jgi:hypothetical protein